MQARYLIPRIKKQYEKYLKYDPDQFRKETLDLGFESRTKGSINTLIVRGFALVRAAAMLQLEMAHYDVQMQGGIVMCRGEVAEMRTGEGKTLTATLPMFIRALAGEGALLATSNDYLAKRDAEIVKPIYDLLGMTIGVIQTDMSREDRRESYKCDITYGTMKEFGFDFLRDHSARREQQQQDLYFGGSEADGATGTVHRKPYFILIDEADSILIDEARTPLIISAPGDDSAQQQETSLYKWSAKSAPKFEEEEHYWYDRERRKVDLTPDGTALVREVVKPKDLAGIGLLQMYDFVEQAIQVLRDYKVDRDYVVRDGEIVIVDEATGRISEGRRWSRGIHQAIEAKENVDVSVDTATNAKITVQSFVSRYPHMAGMTGTAFTSAREFKKIYTMGVSVIPTNKKRQRKELPIKYFSTEEAKLSQIAVDVQRLHEKGRPILIGTRSIAKSETVSAALKQLNIPHDVLNARQIEREAEIVENAGQKQRVTVATNMAGRGTDIKIDDEVRSLGGLHVIGTEMHESSRIDQQLFGRCGRQGDPGTVQLYISAEDKLLESAYGKQKADRIRRRSRFRGRGYWIRLFEKAQQKVEVQHYRSRKILMFNEKQLAKSQREMGLDPILDNFE